MALYSFGGVNDQCSVTSWAVQETGMLPLLSCDSGMTARLKHKEKGPLVSGEEEDSSTTVQFFFKGKKVQWQILKEKKISIWHD